MAVDSASKKKAGPSSQPNENLVGDRLQALKAQSQSNRILSRLNKFVSHGSQGQREGLKLKKPSEYIANDFFKMLRKHTGTR